MSDEYNCPPVCRTCQRAHRGPCQPDQPSELSVTAGSGSDALWTWFGLDRASFLIVPRVLMHEMPDEWQAKMAALLDEYDATFTRWPDGWGVRAQLTNNGKMIGAPEWLVNYRYPDRQAINALRSNTTVRRAEDGPDTPR